ncbi:MAG: triple tyrosine motif-containing protein [Bacteroidetes bacterium]|nr:triple tyrosine motif-containing protein [Bacteroidota bacterium]
MNWKLIKISLLSFFLLCISFYTKAQQLDIKNFSIEDGLPQSQILDICQDHNGIVWVATNGGGVSRFDGKVFHNLGTKEGLNNNRVYSVFEDSKQNMWIGTTKGLNRYSNNKLIKIQDSILGQLTIYRIHEHSTGELWLGTSDGIMIYDGKKVTPFIRNDSIGHYQVWAIKQDKLGNTWIGTVPNGLFCFDGKKITHFGVRDGIIDLKNRDILINDDKVWITTYRGINVYDLSKTYTGRQKFDTLKVNGKPFLEGAYRLFKDASGAIWAGTSTGVSQITYGKSKNISKSNGLPNGMVCGITQDREGNMWFGSFGGGLSIYRNDLFVNINEQHGLANNTVMSFFKDSQDNMWIGTWSGGVSKLDYDAWKNRDTIIIQNYTQQKDGLPFNNIWAICEDKIGNIWFGTSAQGVSVFNGKTFKNYHLKDGLHGVHIAAMLVDKKGNVWIAHENGLDKYDGKTFNFYGNEQGIFSEGVNAIFEDNLGNIWFGSTNKIVKYDGKSFSTISRQEGFPKIRNITRDNYGYMWFSTDAGVVVYNGRAFKNITENDGLSSNMVYFVHADNDGYLWLGTNNGIDRLDLSQFVNQKEIVLKHYGKEDGFIGLECNQNAFYKDYDGKLWIGTIGGVTIYDSKHEKSNPLEPQTHINSIRLFLEHSDYSKYSDSVQDGLPLDLKLPYDKNHITFDFIGISLTNPYKVKYQFMLQGFDLNWLPIGKEISATYSNLPPGKYTFLLKACNNDGLWNRTPVSYSFEIIPPFWKRTWFYIFSIIAGLGIILIIIKVRISAH